MKRLKRFLTNACVILVLTLVCFALLNLVAHQIFLVLRGDRLSLHRGEYFLAPSSPEGIAILKRNLATDDIEKIRNLAEGDPGIRPHPVLHFSTGLSRPYYTLGIEGLRYETGWTDDQVRQFLRQPGEHTYVFGGSTTFGHGVPDDQTLVAQLNRQEGEDLFLNFGALAYDSIREVDKLLYLLRKGYRPGRVIFFDGLNDVILFAGTPYPAHDKPWMEGLLMDRGQVPLIFGYPRRRNMIFSLAFSFPVVQLVQRLGIESRSIDEYRPVDLDASDLDWQGLVHFYENWDRKQHDRRQELADELVNYYQEKINFVRTLGKSFGFESTFVFQPIGFLEEGQPFLKEAFRQSRVSEIYRAVDQSVRAAIADKRLDMIDCSRAISDSGETARAYVDATHYSPLGNSIVAGCIQGREDGRWTTAGESEGGGRNSEESAVFAELRLSVPSVVNKSLSTFKEGAP